MNETMQVCLRPHGSCRCSVQRGPFLRSRRRPTTVTCRLGVLDEMRAISGSVQFGEDAP
jgi:hypothetical protein